MKVLRIILRTLLFLLLTVLTQIGGVVYLISLFTHPYIRKSIQNKYTRAITYCASFLLLYCLFTFLIVPPVAKYFGRERLPATKTGHLKPLTKLTCLLNRNYVRPAMKATILEVAEQMHEQYPGTTVNYLDANFPFITGFPLFPHLSHNDGRKLDLSFCYTDANTGQQTNASPSCIGYGICEEPLPGEENTAAFCAEKGYWQYSMLRKIVPQGNKKNFKIDNERTRSLIHLIVSKESIGKIFIEPHLKTRWKLVSDKIRFHGCQAVRHDDHIHIQLIQ